jgi:hypothetical protein
VPDEGGRVPRFGASGDDGARHRAGRQSPARPTGAAPARAARREPRVPDTLRWATSAGRALRRTRHEGGSIGSAVPGTGCQSARSRSRPVRAAHDSTAAAGSPARGVGRNDQSARRRDYFFFAPRLARRARLRFRPRLWAAFFFALMRRPLRDRSRLYLGRFLTLLFERCPVATAGLPFGRGRSLLKPAPPSRGVPSYLVLAGCNLATIPPYYDRAVR